MTQINPLAYLVKNPPKAAIYKVLLHYFDSLHLHDKLKDLTKNLIDTNCDSRAVTGI